MLKKIILCVILMLLLQVTALAKEMTSRDCAIVMDIPDHFVSQQPNYSLHEVAKFTDGKYFRVKIQMINNPELRDEYHCPPDVLEGLKQHQLQFLKNNGDDVYYVSEVFTENHRHKFIEFMCFEKQDGERYHKTVYLGFMHGQTYYITIRTLWSQEKKLKYDGQGIVEDIIKTEYRLQESFDCNW